MRHPQRRRTLTDADRDEWAAYARFVKLFPERSVRRDPPSPPTSIATPIATPATMSEPRPAPPPALKKPPARPTATPLAVGATPGGLDAASWKRLRSGRLVPERQIDLHGQTAQRAHAALIAFLRHAHADQVRCVEVVTGRGSGEAGGVLRRELPHWLNLPDLRPLVLAAVHPHPANPGAVRLLLRRTR